MEHKQTEATITAVDEAQGIVEAIWAVMGNVDEGGDVIHPGAFTKTFSERGHQVKLLDNHRTDSVMASLGLVKELREVKRGELPQEMLERYPEATGGAWGKFQFLLDTPEGKGAFTRIQRGAVKGWSFGYDPVDKDYSKVPVRDGQPMSVRNLRQLRLYEVSPVLFPMNEATTTTGAKKDPSKAVNLSRQVEDVRQAFMSLYNPPQGPWHYWVNTVYDEYLIICYEGAEGVEYYQIPYTQANDQYTFAPMGEWIEGEYEFTPGKSLKTGRVLSGRNAGRIRAALDALSETLKEAGLYEESEDDNDKSAGPPESADTSTSDAKEAGTPEDDSTRIKSLIQLEQEKLKLLEV